MSKWKGKQEHWKNMALSRADHWKGVRMKFYWEETLKTWNHKKVFLHTAIASLYLSTVTFHCLVVPLCVYLHLNQPSLWWRTALHVWRLLLGKHHFRIIECLNVLGRKLSDFCVLYFSTLIWRDEWDLEQLTREELYLRLIQQVQHILGVGIKVKNMVCCRPDKNGFFSYLCNKGTALSSFAKSQRTTQKKATPKEHYFNTVGTLWTHGNSCLIQIPALFLMNKNNLFSLSSALNSKGMPLTLASQTTYNDLPASLKHLVSAAGNGIQLPQVFALWSLTPSESLGDVHLWSWS